MKSSGNRTMKDRIMFSADLSGFENTPRGVVKKFPTSLIHPYSRSERAQYNINENEDEEKRGSL